MFNFFGGKSSDDHKLFFNTDIHCHIVPGIDDGAATTEKSLSLIRRMMGWGIRRIIATPHVTEDTFENTPEIIEEAFGHLTNVLKSAHVDIDISHSAEYRIDEFFVSQIEAGNIRPYPNNYLLVENSYVQEPWNLEQTIFDLRMKGWKPILAHPERYMYYYDNRARYKRLHDTGLLFQVNVLSLAGHYGKDVKHVAEFLIENGMVDLLGTDLHRSSHADSIDRYLRSKDYRRHRDQLEGLILNDEIFG